MTLVSVVLASFNRLPVLELTIATVREELLGIDHEIIVVDGGSTDGAVQWLSAQKDIITIVQHNRGQWNGHPIRRRSWGYFMNLGFRCAQGKYICMISDDCLVVPSSIRNGIRRVEEESTRGVKVGAVAFYYRDFPTYEKYRVQYTLGNRLFVNHGLFLNDALRSVGYADEKNYMFCHGDGDLGLKLWNAGYVIIDSPDSFIEHLAHSNMNVRASNHALQHKDWDRYLEVWKGVCYDPDVDAIDGVKEQAYVDKTNTADLFRRVRVRHLISNYIVLMRLGPKYLQSNEVPFDALVKRLAARIRALLRGKWLVSGGSSRGRHYNKR